MKEFDSTMSLTRGLCGEPHVVTAVDPAFQPGVQTKKSKIRLFRTGFIVLWQPPGRLCLNRTPFTTTSSTCQ